MPYCEIVCFYFHFIFLSDINQIIFIVVKIYGWPTGIFYFCNTRNSRREFSTRSYRYNLEAFQLRTWIVARLTVQLSACSPRHRHSPQNREVTSVVTWCNLKSLYHRDTSNEPTNRGGKRINCIFARGG